MALALAVLSLLPTVFHLVENPQLIHNLDVSLCRKLPEVPVLCVLIASICDTLRSRAALQIEILAPRHQLGVLQRSVKRPRLTKTDRFFWAWLSQAWADWRSAIVIVKPETVLAWQRRSFQLFWTWKVHHGQPGRPSIQRGTDLIRASAALIHCGALRGLIGELLKLGIDIGQTSVAKYMLRRKPPASQTWKTFLTNNVANLVSVDFFTVSTIWFQVLCVSGLGP